MRFIGSKNLLLNEIENVIKENTQDAKTFCDIFSGTSSVARYFKKDFEVTTNDTLHFSYALQKATITNSRYPLFKKLKKNISEDPFDYFEKKHITPRDIRGRTFIHDNYSPNKKSERKYFSNENALRVDFIRQTIEEWNEKGLLNENEYYYLLAGLIEAVPFVSNIAGTYGAYLKHWDKRASKKLELVKLEVHDNAKNNRCYNQDADILINNIEGDILYIDPPYNTRQYVPNYHILETISKYDSPEIYGKTGMRPYEDKKSKYCMKREVLSSFSNLIKNAKFKHIIVSYSTEGIMSEKEITSILMRYGNKNTYKLYRIPYRRYKHKPGHVDHKLEELLFYVAKGKLQDDK